MIPEQVYRRAVEITTERLRLVMASLHEQDKETDAFKAQRRKDYITLVSDDANFEANYPAFEQQYPGGFDREADLMLARARRNNG